jgi:hypothetical protein
MLQCPANQDDFYIAFMNNTHRKNGDRYRSPNDLRRHP